MYSWGDGGFSTFGLSTPSGSCAASFFEEFLPSVAAIILMAHCVVILIWHCVTRSMRSAALAGVNALCVSRKKHSSHSTVSEGPRRVVAPPLSHLTLPANLPETQNCQCWRQRACSSCVRCVLSSSRSGDRTLNSSPNYLVLFWLCVDCSLWDTPNSYLFDGKCFHTTGFVIVAASFGQTNGLTSCMTPPGEPSLLLYPERGHTGAGCLQSVSTETHCK